MPFELCNMRAYWRRVPVGAGSDHFFRRLPADGLFPKAPATGRVAGIEPKSFRDDARFCAVDRLPRLPEACAPPCVARAGEDTRFFAVEVALARVVGFFFFDVRELAAVRLFVVGFFVVDFDVRTALAFVFGAGAAGSGSGAASAE